MDQHMSGEERGGEGQAGSERSERGSPAPGVQEAAPLLIMDARGQQWHTARKKVFIILFIFIYKCKW
jgi:hypothetical protein